MSAKTVVGLMMVGAAMMWIIMAAVPKATDEQCRLDAVNAMCGVYGNRSGGATEVLKDDGGFYVVCENDRMVESWKNVTINMT